MTRTRKTGNAAKAGRTQAVVPLEDMVNLIQRARPLIKVHLELYNLERMSLWDRRDRVTERIEGDALRRARIGSTYESARNSPDAGIRRVAAYGGKLYSEQVEGLLDVAKILRSLRHRELEILDESVTAFVISERIVGDDGWDGGAIESINFFLHWLKERAFICRYCDRKFVSVASLRGGRPRRTCSDACKQSAFRQRRQAQI
jgi:hypothetical protein